MPGAGLVRKLATLLVRGELGICYGTLRLASDISATKGFCADTPARTSGGAGIVEQ